MENLLKICPVCGFDNLENYPYSDNNGNNPSYEVCSCCEYEFGYDDANKNYTFEKYRKEWIERGFPFFYKEEEPENWNEKYMRKQLKNIKKVNYLPRIFQ